jgi:antitoxin FitA
MGVTHPAWYSNPQIASVCQVKSIQIRKVPDDVHRVLRTRAAAAGLSLSDYALQELERVAEHPPVADVLVQARGRAGGASAEAIVAAVRSGRDRN